MRNRDDFVAVVQDRALVWRRIAYLICGDWIRAEDLVQQALLRMYVRWNHIERATVDAYARKVITRLAIDESRRPYRRSEVSGELPEIPVAEVNIADILAVRAALPAGTTSTTSRGGIALLPRPFRCRDRRCHGRYPGHGQIADRTGALHDASRT